MSDQIIPLVILDEAGAVADVVACNRKSRNKSVEQGELWVALPENGRVLPYRQGGVPCGPFTLPDVDAAPFAVVAAFGHVSTVSSAGGRQKNVSASDKEAAPAAPAAPSTTAAPSHNADANEARIAVLSDLADLIARRRREMPEGSYTTHLFTKGGEKIRKKTGEEAIEVILAQTSEELTSEAADLLYHLMVLLEWEGVRIETVIQELQRR